jgi:hypothetical protein
MNMANDTTTGYSGGWNAYNYTGSQILTFSQTDYPMLSRLAGVKTAQATEFALSVQYALETFSGTGVTEDTSQTAPTAVAYEKTTEKNVIQIFHKSIAVTYNKLSSNNRLRFVESGSTGYAYSNDPLQNAVNSEFEFQRARVLEQCYGNLETALTTGTYAISTSSSVANTMRGIVSACSTNTVSAGSATLSKELIDELLLTMANSGAKFRRIVCFANGFQKQQIGNIYGYAPMDRRVGGVNILQVETDFGSFEVVYDPFMTTSTVLFADLSYCYLVNQPVPGKTYLPDGLFFEEEIAKTGASERRQVYGQLGFDYGGEKLHGTITSLATS